MKHGWLICGVLAACGQPEARTVTSVAAPAESPRVVVPPAKSIILITIDTLRADVLGYAGGAAVTPVLDDLARRGWAFDRCYANSMLTNPSHASLMTSVYPRDHGVYDNESGIADGVRTLAASMQRQGRRTTAIVNFPHLNPEVANLGQGFERVIPAARIERRADDTVKLALSAIDEFDPGEEFFVWLHFSDPHAPYDPTAEHAPRPVTLAHPTPMATAAQHAPSFQKKNVWFKEVFKTVKTAEELQARYVAEVEGVDAALARLLAGLNQRQRAERTTLVVTSDHGENFGEHQLYFNHGGLYQTAVHVPLIVAVPGATPMRIAGQVEQVDVTPTLLELVGAPRWEPMRGHSLVGLVAGREPPREFVFSEHMLGQLVAVRGHGGTLILHRKTSAQFPSYRFVAGRREVYDTSSDPDELHDVGPEGPLYDTLQAALNTYLEAGLNLVARPSLLSDRESLKHLGYVE